MDLMFKYYNIAWKYLKDFATISSENISSSYWGGGGGNPFISPKNTDLLF